MASSFGWVDYSETERRRMIELISRFGEQDTRDELGIGTVRDAFADLMFPGTSTIQTRARYMLFIPWIYIAHERRRTPTGEVRGKARQDEVSLIYALLKTADTDGVIGKEAKAGLQRLPSTIYWSGLGVWGIRRFEGSQEQYHRSLSRWYIRKANLRKEDGEFLDGILRENWDPAIPPQPEGFPHSASLELTKEEAVYLYDRIVKNCNNSVLAHLVDKTRPAEVKFPWMHPELASFPPNLREQIEHARNFSEAMHGAALLYNLMLAEQKRDNELIIEYEAALTEWSGRLARRPELRAWDRRRFWETVEQQNAAIPYSTRRFVDRWLDSALLRFGSEMVGDKSARDLIAEREYTLKRSRARLQNRRALDNWNGAAGTAQLNYRWRVVNSIVNDILRGLEGNNA